MFRAPLFICGLQKNYTLSSVKIQHISSICCDILCDKIKDSRSGRLWTPERELFLRFIYAYGKMPLIFFVLTSLRRAMM